MTEIRETVKNFMEYKDVTIARGAIAKSLGVIAFEQVRITPHFKRVIINKW